MFNVQPFPALRMVATRLAEGGMPVTWQPCRVVGIDASAEQPQYVIEIRGTDGSFCLDRTDQIRKPEPR